MILKINIDPNKSNELQVVDFIKFIMSIGVICVHLGVNILKLESTKIDRSSDELWVFRT